MIGTNTYRVIVDTAFGDLLIKGKGCVPYVPGVSGRCNTVGLVKLDHGNYTGLDGISNFGPPGFRTFAQYKIFKADVTMAGLQSHGQYVGYIYNHTEKMFGHGPNRANGILGFGFSRQSEMFIVSKNRSETLISSLSQENRFSNSFAICFAPSGTGGRMIIGGGELANMQFTPLVRGIQYIVKLSSIAINRVTLPNTAGLKALVDSGTTFMMVPEHVLDAIASQLCPALKRIGLPCHVNQQRKTYVPATINITCGHEEASQLFKLQSISISLSRARLVVSPRSYFTYYRGDGQICTYRYGIHSNEHYMSASPSRVILGIVALLGHLVYFDTPNHQVGFSIVDKIMQLLAMILDKRWQNMNIKIPAVPQRQGQQNKWLT
eukprot:Ihof_evm7s32 gene=Ihof_evmTU7s32